MSAVQVQKGADGFTLSRTFRNWPSAQAALNLLLSVNEAAFEPPAVDPALAKLQVAIEAAEQDDPPPHDGRVGHPVGPDAE